MKRELWRRDASAYSFQATLTPRWADVDTLRHLNNVALLGMHQEARQRWLTETLGLSGSQVYETELRPIDVATDFLLQAHYPDPVLACSQLTSVHEDYFDLATGLFQGGRCVGVQSTRMAVWSDGRPTSLSSELYVVLCEALGDSSFAPSRRSLESDLDNEPPQWHSTTIRYADIDAHRGVGELALARMAEQTRVHLMEQMLARYYKDPRAPRFLVAHVDQQLLIKVSALGAGWMYGAGVVELGRSSMRLRSWVRDPGKRVVAVIDTVLVCTDLITQAPVALSEELRAQLSRLMVRPLRDGEAS